MSWLSRIKAGLTRSTSTVTEGLKASLEAAVETTVKSTQKAVKSTRSALGIPAKLDDHTLEALEEALIAADASLPVAQALIRDLRKAKLPDPLTLQALKSTLAELIAARLAPLNQPFEFTGSPTVILVAGVNGAGKTTTIGKLAAQWAGQGSNVVVAAADTFRAAAVEQLKVWTDRADASTRKGKVTIIPPAKPGADSSSVAYAALEFAQKTNADIVVIDTAGRLPNRADLLAELPKITRVLQKLDTSAPHHTLLVLDATLGQSTLPQVAEFHKTTPLTGLIVTKLDGTAKAGFLLALANQPNPLPVVAIGVGETLDDLGPFDPVAFATALTGA